MIERCAIYIRVSTAEQSMKGHSLQAQREYLESYAASHGMRVVGIYADEGQTARKELKSFDEVIIREKDHSNVIGMLGSDFKEMYSSLSLENRQAFWQQIIKAIYVTKDRNVDYVDFL